MTDADLEIIAHKLADILTERWVRPNSPFMRELTAAWLDTNIPQMTGASLLGATAVEYKHGIREIDATTT